MDSKMPIHFFLSVSIVLLVNGNTLKAQVKEKTSTQEIVRTVFEKGLEHCALDFYAGTLMLHGMSEFSLLNGKEDELREVIGYYKKFGNGEIKAHGNFISYEAGGSGAAYLSWKGIAPELDEQVAVAAKKMMEEQNRSPEGLMTSRHVKEGSDQIFIDVAFAVSPFLLYSGLKFNKSEYVDFAVDETLELFRILKDEGTGLVHQARGFQQPGKISEDCWSRGNGWGAFALSILVRDLSEAHLRYEEVAELAKQFFTAVLRYQDQEGLWHQEMTDPFSYIETSGSGLLLYGLGLMLEKGILENKYMEKFKRGLQGYLSYIGSDGSVSHACKGCLCPGQGTKADYRNHSWIFNDAHAFGPAVLAFTQALKMGITEIASADVPGQDVRDDTMSGEPRTYVVFLPEFNENIAWENDRVAFRVYGPPVKDRVGSGIDVWAKSVDYPVIDKWFRLSKQGKPYHTDHGEGCDFYQVGFGRGMGGTAIWKNGKPYVSKTYSHHKIIRNTEKEIAFELCFDPWDVDGVKVSEKKTISMKMGTNVFKVTSIFETDQKKSIIAAVGISYSSMPEVIADVKKGFLALWESYQPQNGELGSCIIADPKTIRGFSAYENEEFMLVRVKPGKPITWFVGAGWSKSPHFKTKQDWVDYVNAELSRVKF